MKTNPLDNHNSNLRANSIGERTESQPMKLNYAHHSHGSRSGYREHHAPFVQPKDSTRHHHDEQKKQPITHGHTEYLTSAQGGSSFRPHPVGPPPVRRAVPPPPFPFPDEVRSYWPHHHGYGPPQPYHGPPPQSLHGPPSSFHYQGGPTSPRFSCPPPPPVVYVHPSESRAAKRKELVYQVRDTDVLCGRGAPSHFHKGNQYFKHLVEKFQSRYLAARRIDKPEIATLIVDMVRERGGRFLKRTKVQGVGPSGHFCWQDIGDQRAYEKACQALRENAPELRSKIAAKEIAAAAICLDNISHSASDLQHGVSVAVSNGSEVEESPSLEYSHSFFEDRDDVCRGRGRGDSLESRE